MASNQPDIGQQQAMTPLPSGRRHHPEHSASPWPEGHLPGTIHQITARVAGQPGEDMSVRMPLPGSAKPSMPASEMSAIIDAVAPEYRYRSERLVWPSVEGAACTVTTYDLVAAALQFSMLARYQPRKWTRLLELDKPGYAASHQFCLEAALLAIPHLVLEALERNLIFSRGRAPRWGERRGLVGWDQVG
jgi:hypothetical protein